MVGDLERRDIKAAALNSMTGKKETKKIEDSIKDGTLKLLFIAPETLLRTDSYGDYWFLNFLINESKISHIVLDEAHAVVESSGDFRPLYRRLGVVREYFKSAGLDVPITCLTATATPSEILEITSNLGMEDFEVFDHHLYRPNLHYNVIRKLDERRQLMSLLANYNKDTQGLIYCNTRKKCEEVKEYLNRQGFNTEFFHSLLPKKQKKRILDGFVDGSIKIVIRY